ncbi:hypothetical protein KRR26_27735 [Corallococcus sp. M34]|uniref:hypothetical protein n=1 Tax=Citreicoccus inhibens TaxID=2849499 RepID=UPI001C233B7F|nr:hypothetical protein [Citreicoccus inhibens]MBU8899413.1 hypothetical protein [Citreicoccus inhibens]
MPRTFPRAVLAAAVLAAPAVALAGSVYLNGIKIDGVTNQRFEKATVRIDEQGNIYIEAQGYAARVMSVPAPAAPVATTPTPAPAPPAAVAVPASATKEPAPQAVPAAGPPPAASPTPATPPPAVTGPARLTQRYWLVTEQSVPGMTEYDIDLYLNSRWVRKLRNNEEQVVMDITKNLLPGDNTVTLIAHKSAVGSRRSVSAQHVFRVIMGEGNEGGGNVMIDNPLIRFQATAADTQDITKEFTLTTR